MNEKKAYKVTLPIGLDGRREIGEIIMLTELEASNYPGRLVLVDVPHTEVPVVEKALEDMTLVELVEKAKSLDLKHSGSKADLLERIKLHLEGKADAADAKAKADAEEAEAQKQADADAKAKADEEANA